MVIYVYLGPKDWCMLACGGMKIVFTHLMTEYVPILILSRVLNQSSRQHSSRLCCSRCSGLLGNIPLFAYVFIRENISHGFIRRLNQSAEKTVKGLDSANYDGLHIVTGFVA